MIQLNDSESLVSVQQVFSDHRARASWRHTNLLLFPAWGQTHIVDLGLGGGWDEPKSRIVDFCHIAQFWSSGSTDSPGTSYATPRLLSHPLTVQNHSRPLHTHGSASCKVDVGWDLSKKMKISIEKNEKVEKSLNLFERETKFTSIFFVNANILILRWKI